MKTKLTLATFLVAGSIVMMFAAAKVETCEEKFKTCSTTCESELQKCKHSGRPDETCERIHEQCVHQCKNDQIDCQNKQGTQKTTIIKKKVVQPAKKKQS